MKTKQLQKLTLKRARKAALKVFIANALRTGHGLLRFSGRIVGDDFLGCVTDCFCSLLGRRKGRRCSTNYNDNGLKVVIVRIPLAPSFPRW